MTASSSSKFKELNTDDIEVVVDGKDHVWKLIRISHIDISTSKLGQDGKQTHASIKAGTTSILWGLGLELKIKDQSKTGNFLPFTGILYSIVNSRKDKCKLLKKHVLKDLVPSRFNAKLADIKEEHWQAITDHKNQMQTIQYANLALEVQQDIYITQLHRC